MIDFEIEKDVFYNLNVDDLEQIYDIAVEKDSILLVGYARAIHVYYAYGKHFGYVYGLYKGTDYLEYNTKRGILNRIRKHLANGDIEPKFQIFGGQDAD